MDFLKILVLIYIFSTAALFLIGALMHYFFDGEVERLEKTD